MKKKIGLYIRVSTERQAKVDEGSLKSQRQRLNDFVKLSISVHEKEYEIHKIYEDVESGGTVNRPAYQDMLADIKKGKLQAIVSISISRLNRSLIDFYELIELCEEKNVDIISLKENFDTSTAIGRALLKFMLVFYELEREQTAERVADNNYARATRGIKVGPHSILGYQRDLNSPGQLKVDPITSVVVKFIFDEYEKLGSVRLLLEKLKTKGYKTQKGDNFNDQTIRRILTNKAYIAINQINKNNIKKDQDNLPEKKKYIEVEGQWAPIIGLEQFERVNEIFLTNKNSKGNVLSRTRRNFLLAGLIECPICSDREKVLLKTSSGTSKSKKQFYYYKCDVCKEISINADSLEKLVLEKLLLLSSSDILLKELVQKTKHTLDTDYPKYVSEKKKLTLLRKSILEKLDHALNQSLLIDDDDANRILKIKAKELGEEIKRVDQSISLISKKIEKMENEKLDYAFVKEIMGNFNSLIESLSTYEKQQLIKYLVESIKIKDNEVEVTILGDQYISPLKTKKATAVFAVTDVKRSGRDSNSQLPA
jgi:site-specific DNA recombinase